MVEAEADRGGAVRVLRISHSATVAAVARARARAARARRRRHPAGRRAVARGRRRGRRSPRARRLRPSRCGTWGRHPALFVYDPVPLWRALGEQWDVIDIHEEPFALATAEVLLLRALRAPASAVRALHRAEPAQAVPDPVPLAGAVRRCETPPGISACNTEAARIAESQGIRRTSRG